MPPGGDFPGIAILFTEFAARRGQSVPRACSSTRNPAVWPIVSGLAAAIPRQLARLLGPIQRRKLDYQSLFRWVLLCAAEPVAYPALPRRLAVSPLIGY